MLTAAVMPWQASFARMGTEGVLAGMFFMMGLWGMVQYQVRPRMTHLAIGALFWWATYLLYPSYRITIPVFMIGMIFVSWIMSGRPSKKTIQALIPLIVVTMVSVILTILIAQSSWGRGRLEQTSWLGVFGSGNPLTTYVTQDPSLLRARIFNNKIIFFARAFIQEYAAYFSPQFLVTSEARPVWFSVPRVGLVPWWTLVALLIVFASGLRIRSDRSQRSMFLLILVWWCTAPFASALTSEHTPNAHRAYTLALLTPLLVPYAWSSILEWSRQSKKILLSVMLVLVICEAAWFSYNAFVQWGMNTAVVRDDGLLQAAQDIVHTSATGEQIFAFNSGWFPLYYLFAADVYPREIIGRFPGEFQISNIGNVVFERSECPEAAWQQKVQVKESAYFYVHKDCVLSDLAARPGKLTLESAISGSDPRHTSIVRYHYVMPQ